MPVALAGGSGAETVLSVIGGSGGGAEPLFKFLTDAEAMQFSATCRETRAMWLDNKDYHFNKANEQYVKNKKKNKNSLTRAPRGTLFKPVVIYKPNSFGYAGEDIMITDTVFGSFQGAKSSAEAYARKNSGSFTSFTGSYLFPRAIDNGVKYVGRISEYVCIGVKRIAVKY
jgi:hypothetical protein